MDTEQAGRSVQEIEERKTSRLMLGRDLCKGNDDLTTEDLLETPIKLDTLEELSLSE